ncbi:MAG: 1-deoxy-D-xylulose-5-phosphate reductoisomerase [Halanaerobiales bacterium]|nr:1-deoxy-D-xylulose-5-phosphate reductoisomerase [Halanaerobiales bacterium]
MKKLVLLGSTGSIGTQTLEVVDFLAGEWEVIGLTANKNIDLLEEQARKYRPSYLVVMYESLARELEYRLADQRVNILLGLEGLEYLAGLPEADLVINALVGAVGLRPTVAALKAGNKVGLANKESLVIGGELINKYLEENDDFILPIDSEHNALFQILSGHHRDEIKEIILTASGGPFLNLPREGLKDVSVEEALNHPNWNMGCRISIDSATLMNKGLEVIEAHWLFKQPYDKIRVVIHPESIIHSMVEFIDKSIMAELGVADMRIPIQHVLTYPERKWGIGKSLNLLELGKLTFRAPDLEKFPALGLAYAAGREGGSLSVVLNAANEIAVEGFLNKKIPFTDIPRIVEKTMDLHETVAHPDLDEIYEIDKWARRMAEEVLVGCF